MSALNKKKTPYDMLSQPAPLRITPCIENKMCIKEYSGISNISFWHIHASQYVCNCPCWNIMFSMNRYWI